jgi:transcriptional regulator with XRE-family HTH domain
MACAGLGARLFQTRREAGLGLIRLGKLAGVSHSTIGDIEKGRQLPAVDTVERLARAQKVRASWLAFGDVPRAVEAVCHDQRQESGAV